MALRGPDRGGGQLSGAPAGEAWAGGDVHPRLGAALGGLLQASHRLHPEALAAAVARHAELFGARGTRTYVVDLQQRWLAPLDAAPGDAGPRLDVDGTVAGRAFRTASTIVVGDGPVEVWTPLLDGVDRIGVIRVEVDAGEVEVVAAALEPFAAAVTHLIVTKGAYGDHLHQLRRERALDLAAELRWAMLPPLTFRCTELRIAGILEPAYEIAGDSFDYAVDAGTAHLAILDAMGHGLAASDAATLAVAAYRNARRRRLDLVATAGAIDDAVRARYGDRMFVTGQLARLDLARGTLDWLNAGHPVPLRLRHGREVHALTGAPQLPMGLGGVRTSLVRSQLEPGDAVLFFTDGVVDARPGGGERFGEDRLGDRLVTAWASGLGAAETVRRLSIEVLEHQGGRSGDDATLLLAVWDGPAGA